MIIESAPNLCVIVLNSDLGGFGGISRLGVIGSDFLDPFKHLLETRNDTIEPSYKYKFPL